MRFATPSLLLAILSATACTPQTTPTFGYPSIEGVGADLADQAVQQAYVEIGLANVEQAISWAEAEVPGVSPTTIREIYEDAALGYVADEEVPELNERRERYDFSNRFLAKALSMNSNAAAANRGPNIWTSISSIVLSGAGGLMALLADKESNTADWGGGLSLAATTLNGIGKATGWEKKAELYEGCTRTLTFYSGRWAIVHKSVLRENTSLADWKKYLTDEGWLFSEKRDLRCRWPAGYQPSGG